MVFVQGHPKHTLSSEENMVQLLRQGRYQTARDIQEMIWARELFCLQDKEHSNGKHRTHRQHHVLDKAIRLDRFAWIQFR